MCELKSGAGGRADRGTPRWNGLEMEQAAGAGESAMLYVTPLYRLRGRQHPISRQPHDGPLRERRQRRERLLQQEPPNDPPGS